MTSKKATSRPSARSDVRHSISLQLPVELHQLMVKHLEGKMPVNNYVQGLIERDLAVSTQLSHAKLEVAKPKYTLKELLAQTPEDITALTAEDLAWLNMKPVGREIL